MPTLNNTLTCNQIDDVDTLAFLAFGRYPDLAIAGKGCVVCGGRADKFNDKNAENIYFLSATCQKCQTELDIK